MTKQHQAWHGATGILDIGEVSDVDVHDVGQKKKIMEGKKSVTEANTTEDTTITTMDVMNCFMRSHQARHEAAL